MPVNNKSKYKPTKNIAVDMAGACITFYEMRNRKLERITLSIDYWQKFSDYVKKTMPDYEFDQQVDFDGVLIVKGSSFQITPLYAHCRDQKPIAIT